MLTARTLIAFLLLDLAAVDGLVALPGAIVRPQPTLSPATPVMPLPRPAARVASRAGATEMAFNLKKFKEPAVKVLERVACMHDLCGQGVPQLGQPGAQVLLRQLRGEARRPLHQERLPRLRPHARHLHHRVARLDGRLQVCALQHHPGDPAQHHLQLRFGGLPAHAGGPQGIRHRAGVVQLPLPGHAPPDWLLVRPDRVRPLSQDSRAERGGQAAGAARLFGLSARGATQATALWLARGRVVRGDGCGGRSGRLVARGCHRPKREACGMK
eukprot:5433793-Prymnesium_polylepis.1